MFDFNLPVKAIPENYREFLPTLTTPAVDELIASYAEGEEEMRRLHEALMKEGTRKTLAMFADGAQVYYQSASHGRSWGVEFMELFDLERAVNARRETYWFKLFDACCLTTVLPADLWNQWSETFTSWRTGKGLALPPFTHETVYKCLSLIDGHRANFFSMRVDSVWRSLSGWHKTNAGSGFGERFIIDFMFNDWGGTTGKDRAFQDLVNVCTTVLNGADDPFFNAYGELRHARDKHLGEWVELLDGILRIKAFKRGTLHCDVHPEIARRLNVALAYLHPTALHDEATLKKPRRKSGFGSADLMAFKVPRQVRSYLTNAIQLQRDDGLWLLKYAGNYMPKIGGIIKEMIDSVLAQVGGVPAEEGHLFDYPPMEVVSEIVRKGEVPEARSHQFYATPTEVAKDFVAWVGLDEDASCYETSAGTGNIAKHMPLQTVCVEVDRLRCMVLDKLGFEVKQADFLQLKPEDLNGQVDAVLMNPPFAGRQWQDHVEHGLGFVREGGVLAAILPEGAKTKMPEVDGFAVEYTEVKRNLFDGTSIGVVYARIVKEAKAKSVPTEPVKQQSGEQGVEQFGLFEAA